MSAMTFDTYQFIQTLEQAGMPLKQAEAISQAFKTVQHETEPATKADVKMEMLAMRSDIREMEQRLDARIDKQTWMINILVALAVANFAKQFF
ncbi:MAG: hypothetical protein Q8O31_08390 [Rhodocyclaceae bacterium]|nr:hypothetical protein [Rhodocyclaceae bacterium]